MKKLFLIRNPEMFQGEKYLKSNKNYFEGWYFKNTTKDNSISFIPGISINKNEKKAFIQVITTYSSYFINYDINEFEFNHEPFYIKIGNNYFSKDNIHIDIKDKSNNLIIYGDISYTNGKNINTSLLNPNIMGPFSYIPFMECNHAIINMQNTINGFMNINDEKIAFDNDTGYIEKDWGYSFPNSYIWVQGNNFKNRKASLMLSIADIPFKIFNFRGIICVLKIDNTEYKFTTYNNTKLIKYDITNDSINITLRKKDYYLNIKSKYANEFKLIAPVNGKMEKNILESIHSSIFVTLKKDKEIIFNDISKNCGLEIVWN